MRQLFFCLLAGWLATTALRLPAQSAATNKPPETAEQREARLKARWIATLNNALDDFQNNNDQGSATFISGIIDSLNQPGGTSPESLALDRDRMNARVRELVRRGAIGSASAFQMLMYNIWPLASANTNASAGGPPEAHCKTGGTPGPGGLVLYLPFDIADSNGAVHDESGAGNDGQVFGAQWVPDGKFGGAYQFHITNLTDRIVIPNSDTLNADHITIALWIKTSTRDGFWSRVVDKDYRNAYCLDLGGDWRNRFSRGKLEFETSAGALESDRALNDGRWHHIAATYDGQTIRNYVDGVEKARRARTPGPLKKSGWDLCIGNSVVEYGTGEFLAFDGLIDEVRIYNRALSGPEIKSLATGTHAGLDVIHVPPPGTAQGDPTERLKKLKDLYQQGLITQEQYNEKVKEIMDSL